MIITNIFYYFEKLYNQSYRHACEESFTVLCVFNIYTCENEKQ